MRQLNSLELEKKYSKYYTKLDADHKQAFREFFTFNLGENKTVETNLNLYDYQFNQELNDILNNEYCENYSIKQYVGSHTTTQELFSTGYAVRVNAIPRDQLTLIKKSLLKLNFLSKNGRYQNSGSDILKDYDQLLKLSDVGSDTFWIENQNEILKIKGIQDLIIDTELLGVVAEYLGTPPILAQISSWISLPTLKANTNLNVNAQMYHQDKEFTKFIKVFIYLNDVTEENGAHWYIEGSHKDDLASKGVPFSSRVDDKKIIQYYKKSALKCAEGPAGTMIFGDTSSVHKGGVVRDGHRIMLQLEFCSSLINSPVPMLNKNIDFSKKLNMDSYLHCRLLDNFLDTNSEQIVVKASTSSYPPQTTSTRGQSILNKIKSFYYKIVKKIG